MRIGLAAHSITHLSSKLMRYPNIGAAPLAANFSKSRAKSLHICGRGNTSMETCSSAGFDGEVRGIERKPPPEAQKGLSLALLQDPLGTLNEGTGVVPGADGFDIPIAVRSRTRSAVNASLGKAFPQKMNSQCGECADVLETRGRTHGSSNEDALSLHSSAHGGETGILSSHEIKQHCLTAAANWRAAGIRVAKSSDDLLAEQACHAAAIGVNMRTAQEFYSMPFDFMDKSVTSILLAGSR